VVIGASVLLLLFLLRQETPRGTSLLALEIDAALLGLLPYWLVKSSSGQGVPPDTSSATDQRPVSGDACVAQEHDRANSVRGECLPECEQLAAEICSWDKQDCVPCVMQ
jgi:hypothetical protein